MHHTPVLDAGAFRLYIGDKKLAQDRALLRRLNIRYILNATPPLTGGGVANFFEKERDLSLIHI